MVFVLTVHLCFQTQYQIYSTGSGILPLPMNNTGFQKNEKPYAILQNKECFLKLSVLPHEQRQITAELYMNTETDFFFFKSLCQNSWCECIQESFQSRL